MSISRNAVKRRLKVCPFGVHFLVDVGSALKKPLVDFRNYWVLEIFSYLTLLCHWKSIFATSLLILMNFIIIQHPSSLHILKKIESFPQISFISRDGHSICMSFSIQVLSYQDDLFKWCWEGFNMTGLNYPKMVMLGGIW